MTTTTFAGPLDRLRAHLARAEPASTAWLDLAWARGVLVAARAGRADDASVVSLLDREWAVFRAGHPDAPAVAFRPPPEPPEEPVRPGPPRYDLLVPLRHGRYGLDLPAEEAPF